MQDWAVFSSRALAVVLAATALTHCGEEEDPGPSCDELVQRAFDTRQSAIQNASLACEQDTDCLIGYYGLECLDDCGTQVLLARTSVPAVQAATEAANRAYCQPFNERECPLIHPPCVRLDTYRPICRGGRCDAEPTP
jgi:hypothetical protein